MGICYEGVRAIISYLEEDRGDIGASQHRRIFMLWTDIGGEQDNCFGEQRHCLDGFWLNNAKST